MIYEYERKDGLEEQLREKTVIASTITCDDLFSVEAVLVSLGWNGNDDVFLKEDTWNARNTPIDKQFNLMHNEKDIIGHITSAKVVSNGIIIPDNTKLEDVPNDFDIIVGSVIYSKFKDINWQVRASDLIQEIKDGIWKVSMECWHSQFDYALKAPSGEEKIIARNENTAFLTKHLRRYHGTGEYEGYRLARVLRNFYFSGKGLVKTPANKKSIFTNFSGAETEMTITYSEAQYKALEDKLALVEKSAKETLDKAFAKETDEYKNKIQKLESDLAASVAEITKVSDQIKDLQGKLNVAAEVDKNKDEQIKTLESAKADLQKKVDEYVEAKKKADQEKAQADRLVKLSKVNVAEDKAKALVEQFSNVSDEVFETLVSSFPVKAETRQVEAELDLDDLDNDEPALAVANTDEVKEVRSATAAWLKASFQKKK